MSNSASKSILVALSRIYGWFATVPFRFRANDIATPDAICHAQWITYLSSHFNRPGMRVLEIGSRNVTGTNLRSRFSKAEYVGFDLYAGENVDVVGDAHRLTSYFSSEDRFDLIFSSAVFEHLYMPWIVAVEIQKMLKLGGHVFVETHFSFSSHERPWNFFQFSDMGLRALFNEALGFELIGSGMSNPIAGYFSPSADPYLRYRPVKEMYCHSEILCKKKINVEVFDWAQIETDAILNGTHYQQNARE